MASTTAKGSGSTVNDGGTVVGAGNVPAGSPVTKTISVKDLNTGNEYGAFASLTAGKKYTFTILVYGRTSTGVTSFRTYPELKVSDSSATLSYEFSYSFGPSADGIEEFNRVSFVISGSISVTASSNFSVLVKDVRGTTGSNSITFSGKAYIQEVGSIN